MRDTEASTVANFLSMNSSVDLESLSSCILTKGKISSLPLSKSYVNFWA